MIDLRSDTVTMPSREMLAAVQTAKLGDSGRRDSERRGEDPTVNVLEDYAARLVGKEAAAYCVSGIMGNLAALLTHCAPGDLVLVDEHQHLYQREKSAFNPRLGQLQVAMYSANQDGLPNVADIEKKLSQNNVKLLCIENSNNDRGGICIPLVTMQKIYQLAHKYQVPVHLDGARLFNAAFCLQTEAKELTKYTDSVMFCVSKGLGAPVGSLVCGSKEFIYNLREVRRWIGGDMRQAGVIAVQALYALQHNIPLLKEDNRRAKNLSTNLDKLNNIHLSPKVEQI